MRVLLVEDEALIALHMEDLIADLGHEVAANAMRLDEALELAERSDFDFAILDINLAGVMSFPVADLLERRGVPYAFTTGYAHSGVQAPYNARPIVRKPVAVDELNRVLSCVAAPQTAV
jgi:CheY-like chemotaxis protein